MMAGGAPILLNNIKDGVQRFAFLFKKDLVQLQPINNRISKWGIYKNGQPVILADSTIDFDYKNDWRISNYPQEAGAFQSYNKVAIPFDARITLVKGGSDSVRESFLKAIENAAKSLDLYDIVIPEKVYNNATIGHFDYRRTTTNGVGLLAVDIWLVAIRVTVSPTFSNTASPSGANPVTPGSVQTAKPTQTQAQKVIAKIKASKSFINFSSARGVTGSW